MRIIHFSDFHLRPNGLGKRSMDIFHRMMEIFLCHIMPIAF